MLKSIKRWTQVTKFSNPIVFTFLPTGLALDLIKGIDPQITIYYCIDKFIDSSSAAKKIQKTEKKIIQKADLVFVTAKKLLDYATQFNDKVYTFPFAVNLNNFEAARDDHNYQVPEDIKSLPHPIIGYIGGIHKWIDFELLEFLAKAMPETSFVMVGPIQTGISRFKGYKNLYFLGHKQHTDLPHYVKTFNVCLIPYLLTSYTENVYPTKMNEYLSMGKPVISTALPEVKAFNQLNENVIYVGKNKEEFLAKLKEALEQNDEEVIARRIEVASKNTWQKRIADMSELIESTLKIKMAKPINWQEQLTRVYSRYRTRIASVVTTLLILWLLVFHSPLIWYLAGPLEIRENPKKADAIVVLAGGVGESGKAGQGYEERVASGVRLFKEDYAQNLIFSSGYAFVFKEPDVMKALALSLGVPENGIILEKKAANTYQNIIYVNEILNQKHWKRIILVSSPFHMRRVAMVFDKIAPDKKVIYAPVPYSHYYRWPKRLNWLSTRKQITMEQIRGILHEYAGIVYYWWKGWL